MAKQVKESVEFYCVKCRHKTVPKEGSVTEDKTAKGRPMLRARCFYCDGKVVKFVKRQAP